MRFVNLLVGNPPQNVDQLVEATGVTRTAVTEQLNELVAGGFLQRDMERLAGRGRPRYVYSVTDKALNELFAGNQWLVVPALWRAIEDVGGAKLKGQVLRRVSRALANHYRGKIQGNSPAQRLREMAQLLRKEEGNLIEIEESGDGRLAVHRRSCSFYSMFEESRAVCQVEGKMWSAVVGAPVRRTAGRHDGAPCCVFEVAGDK